MSITVTDIYGVLEELAPFQLMETWDNSGLLVGDMQQPCTGVLLALDATSTVLNEVIARGCNTLVIHHPIIFQPLKKIDTSSAEGKFLQKALANNIAIIACHTSFDKASGGVSDYFAKELGLHNRTPLIPQEADNNIGLGCIGTYPQSIEKTEFFRRLLQILHLPGVFTTGTPPQRIRTVALCGGSGSDFAEIAKSRGADLYLSAEIKHHVALWAKENSFCIIDGTHYATEKPAMELLTHCLQKKITENQWSVPVVSSETECAPFVFCDY